MIKLLCYLKYCFDQAQGVMSLGAFALMLFTARDHVCFVLGITTSKGSTLAILAIGILGALLVGWLLVLLKVPNHLKDEENKRNAMAEDIAAIRRRLGA